MRNDGNSLSENSTSRKDLLSHSPTCLSEICHFYFVFMYKIRSLVEFDEGYRHVECVPTMNPHTVKVEFQECKDFCNAENLSIKRQHDGLLVGHGLLDLYVLLDIGVEPNGALDRVLRRPRLHLCQLFCRQYKRRAHIFNKNWKISATCRRRTRVARTFRQGTKSWNSE